MTVTPEQAEEPSQALVAAAAGGLTAFTDANNPFTDAARKEGVQDGLFLRMNGNDGEFSVYPNGDKIVHGTVLAFAIWYAKIGWHGFDRSDRNKGVKGPAVDLRSGVALPDPPADNPDVQWNKMIYVPARALDGSPQMLLSSKADKPTREIWKLIKTYGSLMGRHRDEQGLNKIPLVEIGARSFDMEVDDETKPKLSNGKYPRIKVTKYAESYKIVDWMSEAELREIEAQGAAEAEAAEEAPAQAVQPQPQAQQSPAAPAAPVAEASKLGLGQRLGRYGGRPQAT